MSEAYTWLCWFFVVVIAAAVAVAVVMERKTRGTPSHADWDPSKLPRPEEALWSWVFGSLGSLVNTVLFRQPKQRDRQGAAASSWDEGVGALVRDLKQREPPRDLPRRDHDAPTE